VTPRYSVVIPTRNGAGTLPALLGALRAQRTTGAVEIIAVDSGSTDGTIELLQPQVHSLIRISPEEFDHGLTRNLAVARTHGEFVVLLVQDAVPLGDMFLESLAAPLVADARVAGAFARQQPRPEASAITRHYLDNWIASRPESRTSALVDGRAQLEAMTPMARLLFCAFDNVASCIRRSVWEQRPFKSTPIAEDLAWSLDVLLAGYAIAFAPDAVVLHSHDRGAVYEYRRTRVLHEQLFELFGLQTIPAVPALMRAIATSWVSHARLELRSPGQWARALTLAVAWPLGQYVGGRRAARRDDSATRLPPGTV
jgi:glycosyltransferase involved in cell wall biosynthesis